MARSKYEYDETLPLDAQGKKPKSKPKAKAKRRGRRRSPGVRTILVVLLVLVFTVAPLRSAAEGVLNAGLRQVLGEDTRFEVGLFDPIAFVARQLD